MVLRWGCLERTAFQTKRRRISAAFIEKTVKPQQGERPATTTMKESTENVSLDDASWSQVMCVGLAVSESCVGRAGSRGVQLSRSSSAGELGEAAAILPTGMAQSGSPEPPLLWNESTKHPHSPPEHTGMRLVPPRWGWERISKIVDGGESPWACPGLPFPGYAFRWIPTFAGENLFLKIRFSIRKGWECFGSMFFPVAFWAAWCDVTFCCVSRLKILISLFCCEGRRCTQRSWSSSAKDTVGTDRVWYTGNRYVCLG